MGYEPALLRRDVEQLERLTGALAAGGKAAIVVCPVGLRRAALAWLRGHGADCSQLRELADPDQVAPTLSEDGLQCLAPVEATFEAINLHREKLRGNGTTLLFFDEASAGTFRVSAPDAWSFRDAMVVLRGDFGPPEVEVAPEPERVVSARGGLSRAKSPVERVWAAHELAEALRAIGRPDEAAAVAREALSRLGDSTDAQLELGRAQARVTLVGALAGSGRPAACWREARTASKALGRLGDEAHLQRIWLDAAAFGPPPFFRDRSRAEAARREMDSSDVPRWLDYQLAGTEAVLAIGRGDLLAAAARLSEMSGTADWDAALETRAQARLLDAGGTLLGATDTLRKAAAAFGRAAASSTVVHCTARIAELLTEMVEFDAVDRALERAETAGTAPRDRVRLRRVRARVALGRGSGSGALARLRELVTELAGTELDAALYATCLQIVETAEAAPVDREAARASLEVAEARLLELTTDGPPWYGSLMPALRARITDGEASLALFRQATRHALVEWPELAPVVARPHAIALLDLGRRDEALGVLGLLEGMSVEHHIPREVAWARGLRLRAGACDEAELREAFAATGSGRITANVLLHIAEHGGPVAFADEAAAMYLEMPMPAREARAYEVAGDRLRATGDEAGAVRRYKRALGRMRRYGVRLRLADVEEKLHQRPIQQ